MKMHDQGLFTGNSSLIRADGAIPYLKFAPLDGCNGLDHGVFTRLGGGSGPPYDSLNTSYSVGDIPSRVAENLARIEETMGAGPLLFATQVHKDDIAVIRDDATPIPEKVLRVDAMISDRPGLPLMIKLADCQSVILYDPARRAVANVHCGWRGHVGNILAKTVKHMAAVFGSPASDIIAAVSPSLGPCCAEFTAHEDIFPGYFKEHMVRDDYFDLWDLSRRQLLEAGLKDANIHIAAVCTRCRTDLFFSHRAEGLTGRFCTVAVLTGK
jgi:YfiH family protein